MKPSIYIHRNPYSRGFGLSIYKEGILIVEFRIWHLSGTFYWGTRQNLDADAFSAVLSNHKQELDKAKSECACLRSQIQELSKERTNG